MSFLGIDVGGANLKVAFNGGGRIIYFPMWKMADKLETTLIELSKEYRVEKAGVVMTAELSDVFESKEDGVRYIADACCRAFDEVYFLDIHGNLRKSVDSPSDFAASNWIASTVFLMSEGYRNFLFVDMGSTTTDIIPVTDKINASKTDFERLTRGEMIYFGILRTPVFYVLQEFKGTPLCPEFFSITADVFRITGDIGEDVYTCETPDGKDRDVVSCMRRLARTICCDLEEIGEEKVKELAFMAKESMKNRLKKVLGDKIGRIDVVLACGIGEFLIKDACDEMGVECRLLSELYGEYSNLFPAFAMLRLVQKVQ
ncbi:hydantoinase/oxoprolinase family protein [Archaeoglobus neptunius]|uniref:hydantoinase/oxoprolinase family protein n=1 Tax=Archaeoglobus neptunius TaxID=2798580 RepID=UPI001926D99F|nr:hydantoinase/oxoprolinase family protein [Archaeoglobus neptunius]